MIFKSKRANAITDTLMVIIVLVCFVLFAFVGKYVFKEINTEFQADPDSLNVSKNLMQTEYDRYHTLLDCVFLFILLLVWGLALVASFMIDSHPIFFIFTVILMIFVFIGAVWIGNFYQEEIAADPDLGAFTTDFPIMNWVMNNLLILSVCIGFSVILVLFGKNRAG